MRLKNVADLLTFHNPARTLHTHLLSLSLSVWPRPQAVDDGLDYYSTFVDASMSPWYHGSMSAKEAEALLVIEDDAAHNEGRFLFRDDENAHAVTLDGRVGMYIVSLATGGAVQHHRLVKHIASEQLQLNKGIGKLLR